MENKIQNLKIECIEFDLYARETLHMNYWFGSVLRSRFLCHSESIFNEYGESLRSIIGTLPKSITKEHFMYKQWENGFPKGFVFDCSQIENEQSGFTLKKDEIYTIKLYLIGNYAYLSDLFIQVLYAMFEEKFEDATIDLIKLRHKGTHRFHKSGLIPNTQKVEINFLTPVNLVHKQNLSMNGFQGKLNNFPSLYQFMRSIVFRLLSLKILYTNDYECFTSRNDMDNFIDEFIGDSMRATLYSANIYYERYYSTPKQGRNNLYKLEGYVGTLTFNKVPVQYIPILKFASLLNVGSDINYGLGKFEIKCLMQ